MDEKFLFIIKEKIRLNFSKPIVIGFSGGLDSVCMTTLFLETSIPVIIAHFNHNLRETANRDEEFSRDFAKKRKIPFFSEIGDVNQYSKKYHLSVEESARKLRYEFLFRVAKKNNVDKIAVAHHADDQVETVLMHLLRGSGMTGLVGMKNETIIPEFSNDIKIIRPMLSFWRSEIEEFSKMKGIEFVQDETNFQETYERNQIRHTILPYLNSHYPGLNSRLHKTSIILADENELIENLLKEEWENVCSQIHTKFVRLKRKEFNKFSVAAQRRMIRKAIFLLNPNLRDLSFETGERVIAFSESDKAGEVDLQEKLIAAFSEDEIFFGGISKDWIEILFPQLDGFFNINIGKDRVIHFSKHWHLLIERISKTDRLDIFLDDRFSVYLDVDSFFSENLILRQKKQGDRFQPLGMSEGTIKISDFFINEKLMKASRDKWPLLTNLQDEIIWVPGFRPNHKSQIKDSTVNIVKLSILKNK